MYENAEFKVFLKEDNGQTQQMMTEQFRMTRKKIFHYLKDMGMILIVLKWVPHEMTLSVMKNGCISKIPSINVVMIHQAKRQILLQPFFVDKLSEF